MNIKERENYEQLYLHIKQQIVDAKQDIAECKVQLQEAKVRLFLKIVILFGGTP